MERKLHKLKNTYKKSIIKEKHTKGAKVDVCSKE